MAGNVSTPANIALIIVGVLVATGFFVIALWKAFRDQERAERDRRYLRRVLLRAGLIYVFGAIFGTYEAVTGNQPIQSLIGLPIVLLLAWFYVRSALKLKVPPQ